MATLNLFEPGDITSVYSSIVENQNNWLLLHYVDDSHNELGLHSFGNEGLEELKNKVDDSDKVFIGFYQEECERDPGYVIINYIPPATSAVRKARVLVHSRRIGTIFKKHRAVLTVDSLSLLTFDNIYQAITKQDASVSVTSPIAKTSGDTTPEIIQEPGDIPTIPDSSSLQEPPSPILPVRPPSPFSENPMVGRSSPRPQTPSGPKKFLGSLLKRKKKTKSLENVHGERPPPIPPKFPPAPPKDKDSYYPAPPAISIPSQSPPQPSRISQESRLLRHRRSRSMSDFAVISHTGGDAEDNDVDEPEARPPQLVPLKGKWAPLPTVPNDPAERARRRRELQLKREEDEQEAREAERRRQERIKTEKEKLLKQEAEEEKRRKVEVEEEIRRVREERRKRETMEREEEERKQREFEERKRLNRDRRLEEHRRLEQWREAQARKAEAAAQQAEEMKKREDLERKKRVEEAAAKVKVVKEESELSGWLTILNEDSLAWKRRYYKFVGSTIFLYRDKKDLTTPLDKLDLKYAVKALREWNEGYEDLEAIQFSFVVEFRQDRQYWSLYADTEEEKFKLLGLFKVAGGL